MSNFAPTAEQQNAIDLALTGESLAIEALAGAGKALRWDQPVLTPKGYVPIGSLAVGDAVFGRDGHVHNVLGVYPQGLRPLFAVTFSDRTKVIADADHIWSVQRVDHRLTGCFVNKTTAELQRKLRTTTSSTKMGRSDRAYWFMPMASPVHFDADPFTAIDPYVLGVLLGDGAFGSGKTMISSADDEIIDSVRTYATSLGLSVVHVSRYDYRITGHRQSLPGRRGSWNPIRSALRDLGLAEKKSPDKFVPAELLRGRAEDRLAVLQGLMDTDGSVSRTAAEFTSSSHQLALDVKFLVESLGGTAALSLKRTTHMDAHRLYIKMPADVIPFRLSRKINAMGKNQRPPYRTITSIEPVESDVAVCIEVDSPDHLYLTAGCIPTHNTTVLAAIAAALPNKKGCYAAFNRAIVDDGKGRFPQTVDCRTMHSLAFGAVGRNFQHRLNSPRQRNSQVARLLGITDAFEFRKADGNWKIIPTDRLASLVMKSVKVFCTTDDLIPGVGHVPWQDGLDYPCNDLDPNYGGDASRARCVHGLNREWVGHRTDTHNRALAEMLVPFIIKAWQDVTTPNGVLPYDHAYYLKQWELNAPKINADYILFDEAQDASPVFLSVLAKQTSQLILVGDRYQAIYGFTGARDALSEVKVKNRAWLTQSWRFGPRIAEVANLYLDAMNCPVEMQGNPAIDSTVGPIGSPDAILCRTNAGVIRAAMNGMGDGRAVAVVGGADDLIRFAQGAEALQNGRRAEDPQLQCFDSWDEVNRFVDEDPNGDELKLLVKLVDDFGADKIIRNMGRCTSEKYADLIVSTAHRSKGRQWERVTVDTGFPGEDPETGQPPSLDEMRLQYVAGTRAQHRLDPAGLYLLEEVGASVGGLHDQLW